MRCCDLESIWTVGKKASRHQQTTPRNTLPAKPNAGIHYTTGRTQCFNMTGKSCIEKSGNNLYRRSLRSTAHLPSRLARRAENCPCRFQDVDTGRSWPLDMKALKGLHYRSSTRYP